MSQRRVLGGCCVSRYVTLSKGETLKGAVAAGCFNNGGSVAWVAINPEEQKVFFDAFMEAEIAFEKLGNGQYFFYGSGIQFIEACTMEELRPIIEWEKKEGRKRDEKRIGDIVDLTNLLGRGYEGRVYAFARNGNIFFEVTKSKASYYYPVGRKYDNYLSGFTHDYFPIILPRNKDGSIKDDGK